MFIKRKTNQTKPTIFDYYKDESSSTIEFRRLARNIWQKSSPEIRSLLVTSAIQGEGKTLLASTLAITVAKSENKRVLLVDADLRRANMHSLFGVERDIGLRALLLEEVTLEKAIKDTELENLKILTSGRGVTSPMQLLGSERTKEIFDECRAQFDLVICDAPPIVAVHDAEMLAQHVDGVLLIVLAGKTFREVAIRAIELLQEVQANILGIVMNDTQGTLPYYYQPKYYRKYYGKDYSEGSA
jgi:capsular exopolysaccharide synthesis family protein